jgi:hypothetical protein
VLVVVVQDHHHKVLAAMALPILVAVVRVGLLHLQTKRVALEALALSSFATQAHLLMRQA